MGNGTATPYSTAGGGVVLEHQYGAVLLSQLLSGRPMEELGAEVAPELLIFQASQYSQVDDLLLKGIAANGESRTVSIGVRRSPKIIPSDESTVQLFQDFLQEVVNHKIEFDSGSRRLVLAVAVAGSHTTELRALTSIAKASLDSASFRSTVGRPGRTNQAVRDRLQMIDEIITIASNRIRLDPNAFEPIFMTWRLLRALNVQDLRLEDGNNADRTHAVAGLLELVGHDNFEADQLFSRLVELVGIYAPSGSTVSEISLRQDLYGRKLNRSPNRSVAWGKLDSLEIQMRDRIRDVLRVENEHLKLERNDVLDSLSWEITNLEESGVIVVRGEPDVGKSSLALRAVDQARANGAEVLILNLRDFPNTILEFESYIGGQLNEVFSLASSSPYKLLLIDGAEAALEKKGEILRAIATAGLRAKLNIMVVTRNDGARRVSQIVSEALLNIGVSQQIQDFEVPSFNDDEIRQVSEAFASLRIFISNPSSKWLLGRPGLVQMLLLSNGITELPSGRFSEADVFRIIWKYRVRGESSPLIDSRFWGPREETMKTLALRELFSNSKLGNLDMSAVESLKSDGLLRDSGASGAWIPDQQFASDLVRDMAIARVLITADWALLEECGAPRWALRAVRIAVQATLLREKSVGWKSTLEFFTNLASKFEPRWAEVPLESLLTLGTAQDVIEELLPRLVENDGEHLSTLLRLGVQRFAPNGLGDIQVLAPIVEIFFSREDPLGQFKLSNHEDLISEVHKLVLAWLRTAAFRDLESIDLRKAIRDKILSQVPDPSDQFTLEAIGMLGLDQNDESLGFLKMVSETEPHRLGTVVESDGPIYALVEHHPEVLLLLAESYYIKGEPSDPRRRSYGFTDDGIRRHEAIHSFASPPASWNYGPFYALLRKEPVKSLAFINRMLDHAAIYRVRNLEKEFEDLASIELDLPGVGPTQCIGDSSVWAWYRGTSVGPYPCVSALLAVERFSDSLIEQHRIPLTRVLTLLFKECHNLAIPGLAVGLIERNIEIAENTLDVFLVHPQLWYMEYERISSEGIFQYQQSDTKELQKSGARSLGFLRSVAQMTVKAVLAGDSARLKSLEILGQELIGNHQKNLDQDDSGSLTSAVIRGWAAAFTPEGYKSTQVENGQVLIEYAPPEEVSDILLPRQIESARIGEVMRLENTYSRSGNREVDLSHLQEDIQIAQSLVVSPPTNYPHFPDAIVAVASAAFRAHSTKKAKLDYAELVWCANILIDAALNPWESDYSFGSTFYPMGSDRSAAVAISTLLLPAAEELKLESSKVLEALVAISSSQFDEVRLLFAQSLSLVWNAPCNETSDQDCRHVLLWSALRSGLAVCSMDAWDDVNQRRPYTVLEEPYEVSLPEVKVEDIDLNRLVAPLIACASASSSPSCINVPAKILLNVIIETHLSSTHYSNGENFYISAASHLESTRSLLQLAADGEISPLLQYVRYFSPCADCLEQFLRDCTELFTYSETLRGKMILIWPPIMEAALSEFDKGANPKKRDSRYGSAFSHLIPNPKPSMQERNYEETILLAQVNWIRAEDIFDLVERWIDYAKSDPMSVDAIARLVTDMPLEWQVQNGLSWIEKLIDSKYSLVANRTYFATTWLEKIRSNLEYRSKELGAWLRIVDGLAANRDRNAVRLQINEE